MTTVAASDSADPADRTELEERLVSAFRWHGGHADFAAVWRDPVLVRGLGPALASPFADAAVTAVVGVEARGFVLGALVAEALGVGLVLARKPGSVHPGATSATGADLDWRGRTVELRVSRAAVRRGERLLVVDDWVETGSHVRTLAGLVQSLGAVVAGVAVIVDDTAASVREEFGVVGLVRSAQLRLSE